MAGPLLSAYKECVVGPPELLDVPSWLDYSFGPVVSIDSTSTDTSNATSSASAGPSGGGGGGGGGGSSLLDRR